MKKDGCVWVLICILIIVLSMMSIAYAEIPSDLKEQYKYKQHDSSIIIVKNRLKDLGYFAKDAQFSDFVSDELKTAIKAFQKQNNVPANGIIDKKLLELLFSDDAVEKGGKPRIRTVVVIETPVVTEHKTTSSDRRLNQNVIKEENIGDNKSSSPTWAFVLACACFVFGGVMLSKNPKKTVNQDKTESLHSSSQANVRMNSVSDMKESRSIIHNLETKANYKLETERKQKQWNKTHQKVTEHEKYLQQQAQKQIIQAAYRAQQERIQKQREEERVRQEAERRRQQVIDTVKSHSVKYNQMMKIIKKYDFVKDVSDEYNLSYVFSNRYCFDTVKPMNALAYLADGNERLKAGYEIVKGNRKKQKQYLDEMSKCEETPRFYIQQTGIEHTRFLRIENDLCKSIEPKIKTDLEVTMYLYYRNGGAHALNTYTFHYDEIDSAYSINLIPDIEYVGAREEREKVTPKLRYQIMKRDHFRCVICGASAEEGARLHVDHIQPVSKGGKTVESNLRTLCDKCNLGKSDQYDPNGLN